PAPGGARRKHPELTYAHTPAEFNHSRVLLMIKPC
ncbi:MAG: hypothetical protein QOD04_2550, partial [Pseudonocardiales bacterium]|nr:hypothetical protein [Pseudonocardiales bacterium]